MRSCGFSAKSFVSFPKYFKIALSHVSAKITGADNEEKRQASSEGKKPKLVERKQKFEAAAQQKIYKELGNVWRQAAAERFNKNHQFEKQHRTLIGLEETRARTNA